MEIVCYSATFDAYHVVHEDGVHRWYNEAMLPDELLAEWHAFLAKRQRVDSIEAIEITKSSEKSQSRLRKIKRNGSRQTARPRG